MRKSSIHIRLNKFKVKKYPYHGSAPNLIDKFLIIGYDYDYIERSSNKIISESKQLNAQENSQNLIEIRAKEYPTVINEIANNYEKELLENDIIISLIFPELPYLYYNKSTAQRQNLGNYSVIFSISPAVNEQNTKKSYNCFANIFYEYDKNGLAFPKAFCILSEYPYYASFYNLCLRILNMFRNDMLSIPLEVWLYNFITFTPAPFHNNFDIFISKMLVNPVEEKEKMKKMTVFLGKSKQGKGNNIVIPEQKYDVVSFPMLSGYPLFDFNLPILFNIIPTELIVQIFFYTFLENDIIFYSQNLEILNFIMFVFANFNYPCNDSIYFWHILSISINSFMTGSSKFATKTCSTMIGINSKFDPKVKTTSKISEHFIVDLDQKEFLYVAANNTPEVQKNKKLHEYLDKIMSRPKDEPKDTELTRIIKNLYRSIDTYSKKYTNINQNDEIGQNISSKLYKYDKEIAIQNRNIQLIFYNFILQVFTLYYKNFKLIQEKKEANNDQMNSSVVSNFSTFNKSIRSSTTSNQGFLIEFINDQDITDEFDRLFNNKFKDSSKFGNFLINFLLYYDSIDLFKIPLMFTEEFINRNSFKEKQKEAKLNRKKTDPRISVNDDPIVSDCFDVIDQFYSISKEEDIHQIGDSASKGKVSLLYLNYNEFYDYYEKELKVMITREQIDSKVTEVKIMPATKKTFLAYKKIELDSFLLMKYIYTINGLPDDVLKNIFPLIKYTSQNVIEEFTQASVNDIVEQNLILQKSFQKHDYIFFIIYTLFAATRGLCPNMYAVNELRNLIELSYKINQNLRKYIMKIIHIYLKLMVDAKESKNNEDLEVYNRCLLELKNIILEKGNVIPNEEFMDLINQEVSYSKSNVNENEIDNSNIEDFKEYKIDFRYDNLEGSLKKLKKPKDIAKSFWTLSNNLDIESIITQPDCDKKKDKNAPVTENPPIKIVCSIEGELDSMKIINFYSIRLLFNEANNVYRKYFENTKLKEIDFKELEELLWNCIYYIYLGKEVGYEECDFEIFKDIQQVFVKLFLNIRKIIKNVK